MPQRTATFVGYLRDEGRPYQVRDARALCALFPLLAEARYGLGPDLLIQQQELDYDEDGQPVPPDSIIGADQGAAAWPQLKSTDLLLMVTRPPLDDVPPPGAPRFADGGWMPPGYTWVEERLFESLRTMFDTCCRSHVQLTERWAAFLPAIYADRGSITFLQNRRGRRRDRMAYHLSREVLPASDPPRVVKPKAGVTTWYVAYLARVAEVGVPLLAAFGLSGNDTHRMALTLAEAPQLRSIVVGWLRERPRHDHILMIEMTKLDDRMFDSRTEAVPPVTTRDFRWEIVLDAKLSPAALQPAAR